MLTDEQLTTVWKGFTPPAGWAKWRRDYLDFLSWLRNASGSELRTDAAQRKLWNVGDHRVPRPIGVRRAWSANASAAPAHSLSKGSLG
ncbi:hypothetical protein WMF45_18365 [Sorangium sp. So ce448]|uniref:hypothetical protein n=1 Tax=Sorangium sp. So ce448 TaxID=3133314 RepID=UPI003F63E477